jgi:hypothetical protein
VLRISAQDQTLLSRSRPTAQFVSYDPTATTLSQRRQGVFSVAETQVSIRIDLESGGRIGPEKIALLEAIRETGSITAAAGRCPIAERGY